MGLNRVRLGELIEKYSEICNNPRLSENDVSGVDKEKEFFEPSKQVGADTSKYKVVPPNYFACNLMHVGRDYALPVALNHTQKNKIVSPAYDVFHVIDGAPIMREYLMMMLKSSERDRCFWFMTDSSVRDSMAWEDFCSWEIDLPPLDIQQKYVAVYRAMLANQASVERGLDDLKLTCDAYIEELRRKYSSKEIGNYIEQVKENNSARRYSKVRGVESSSTFIETRAKMQGVDTVKYTVVRRGDFAYNPSRINLGSIAMYDDSEPCIVSPMYEVFRVNQPKELCPEYLMLWLGRKEFQRYTLFNASGSVRDAFGLTSMKEVEIPIPPMDIQDGIVGVYKSYIQRTNIGKKINNLLVRLCPILIKGSIEEAQKRKL